MDNVQLPTTRYVAKPTYLSENSEVNTEVQFPIFQNLFFEWAHGQNGDSIQFHFREKKKRKVLNESNSSPNHSVPGFLSYSTSLSLSRCGRRVVENAGNEDCNVTKGILNCFTPSQEPVLLRGWLKKER